MGQDPEIPRDHGMSVSAWRLLDETVADALELPEPQRCSWIEQRLADHPQLRDIALRLLDHEPEADSFFSARAMPRLESGYMLGNWRLVKELGRGGSSIVWLASRREGQVEMQGAIKLLQTPFASQQMLARFEREKQILASLQHPHIAHLLEARIGPLDLPSFVLEYLDGLPFPAHCAAHKLGLVVRVRLARQILDGLQYAHSRLVIHLDLKPGNILCTAEGLPKLLDFGIARLLQDAVSNAHSDTIYRALSVDYASPEQLRGEAVSMASDIYSAGLVFYEAFTGERARRWSRRPIAELVNDCRQFILPAHNAIPTDLLAILRKATEADPEQRYSSAKSFSADLGRFLDSKPVLARGAGFGYVLGRYMRRHALISGAAAFALLAILATSVVALNLARQASQQREFALLRQQEALRSAEDASRSLSLAEQALDEVRRQHRIAEERREDLLRMSTSFLEDSYRDIADLPGATALRAGLLERTLRNLERIEQNVPEDVDLLVLIVDAMGNLADTYGGVNSNLGDRPKALDLLARREALVTKLGEQAPDSAVTRRLKLDQALRNITLQTNQTAATMRRRLAQLEPDIARLLRTAPDSQAVYRLGISYFFHLAFRAEKPADRLQLYGKVLAVAQEEEKRFGGDDRNWRAMALAHKYAASALPPEDPANRQHAEQAVQFDERRVQLHPTNALARMDLTFSQSTLATAVLASGNIAEAHTILQGVYRQRATLLEIDPENRWYQNSLWYPLAHITRTAFLLGDRQELRRAANELEQTGKRFQPPPYIVATIPVLQAELTADTDPGVRCAYYQQAQQHWSEATAAQQAMFPYRAELDQRLKDCESTLSSAAPFNEAADGVRPPM